MIRASIETLVMGSVPGASVVVLRPLPSEDEHDRILPICIGSVEAAAIGKALSEELGCNSIFTERCNVVFTYLSHFFQICNLSLIHIFLIITI